MSKPHTDPAKKALKGVIKGKQKKLLVEHSKSLERSDSPSFGSTDEALAPSKDESSKTEKALSVKPHSPKHALTSDDELGYLPRSTHSRRPRSPYSELSHSPDGSVRGGRFEPMRSDRYAFQDWDVRPYDNGHLSDKSSDDDAEIEKMGLEVSGPYFVNTPLKLTLDEQFKSLDKELGGPCPKAAEFQSPKEFGIKATISLGPSEYVMSPNNVILSGTRVITARYSVSLTAEMQYQNTIEVYDLMTNAVIFSTKHISNNSLTLHASSRLLVVCEPGDHWKKPKHRWTSITVYERIKDNIIERSTVSLPEQIDKVKFSNDSSTIALLGGFRFCFVFLKGKGFFKLQAEDVTFGDQWLIYSIRRGPTNREYSKLIAVDTHTGTAKCLFNNWHGIETPLSRDILTWTEEDPSMHIIKMIDLNQINLTPQKIGAIPIRFLLRPLSTFIFGDFATLHLVAIIGRGGSVGLLNVGLKTFTVACPRGGRNESIVAASHDSPLLLREADSSVTIVHLKASSMPDYDDLFWRAKACEVVTQKITSTQICDHLLQYMPAPLPFTRLVKIRVQWGSLCAFDENLKYQYVLDENLVIHRKTINSDDNRGSLKLPASVVDEIPLCLETNFNGAVFYLATRRRTKQYIYVINVTSKKIYKYYLKHLAPKIVQIKAHSASKILVVTLRDQRALIFSCKNSRKLRFLNALTKNQMLVSVNQSVVVFEEEKNGILLAIGYIDLTKEGSEPVLFSNKNINFIALDEDDIFLLIADIDLIVRFNVQSKSKTLIKGDWKNPTYSRFSQVRNSNIIQAIGHDFVYRVIDVNTFHKLYSISLSFCRRKGKILQTAISSDGRRVLFGWSREIYIFEIVDPKFPDSLQAFEEAAKAKPVEQPIFFNAMGNRVDRPTPGTHRVYLA